MHLFDTAYSPPNRSTPAGYDMPYTLQVQARDRLELDHLMERRGIGEQYIGKCQNANSSFRGIAYLIDEKDWIGALHEAAILCYVGSCSGALSPRDTVGDLGLIHELIHLMGNVYPNHMIEDKRRYVTKLALKFEAIVPGWPTHYLQYRNGSMFTFRYIATTSPTPLKITSTDMVEDLTENAILMKLKVTKT